MFDDETRAMIAGLAVPPKKVTFDESTITKSRKKVPKRRRRLSPYNMFMRRRPAHVSLQEHARHWKDVPAHVKREMAAEAAEVERSRGGAK